MGFNKCALEMDFVWTHNYDDLQVPNKFMTRYWSIKQIGHAPIVCNTVNAYNKC